MKRLYCEISKADEELGILFGWAIISKINGEDYFDTQEDHVPEEAMMKAAVDFMVSNRALRVMHEGDAIGQVLFAYPLTTDVAEKMNIQSDYSGLMIGVKPNDRTMIDRFKNGELTGFSIGGQRISDEEVI